jgi:hypothetical protein
MSRSDRAPAPVQEAVAKWRVRWPEWAVAEVFLPLAIRPQAAAWQALQVELLDAAWGGEDPRPGEAKLAWWMEELQGWSQARRRHPLGAVLQRAPVDWAALAAAVPGLAASRERPRDGAEARSAVQAAASAVAGIEAVLFGGTPVADAVAACWLQARLASDPGGAVPLTALAGGADAAPAAWAAELLAGWPAGRAAPPPRRLALALARARLRDARPVPPLSALWISWRAARD